MRFTKIIAISSLLLTFLLSIGLAAAPADIRKARVELTSAKSFEDVAGAVESLVSKSGMMVTAKVDQGKMLSMTGLRLEATLFLVGNPTVGKQYGQRRWGESMMPTSSIRRKWKSLGFVSVADHTRTGDMTTFRVRFLFPAGMLCV